MLLKRNCLYLGYNYSGSSKLGSFGIRTLQATYLVRRVSRISESFLCHSLHIRDASENVQLRIAGKKFLKVLRAF